MISQLFYIYELQRFYCKFENVIRWKFVHWLDIFRFRWNLVQFFPWKHVFLELLKSIARKYRYHSAKANWYLVFPWAVQYIQAFFNQIFICPMNEYVFNIDLNSSISPSAYRNPFLVLLRGSQKYKSQQTLYSSETLAILFPILWI